MSECQPVNPFRRDFCITGILTDNTKIIPCDDGSTSVYLDIVGDSYPNLMIMNFNRPQGVTIFNQTPDVLEKLMQCFIDKATLRIESIDGVLTVTKLNQ